MKVKELRVLSSEDLTKKEKEFKKELFELNFQRKVGRVEHPARFTHLNQAIARIQTILRERQISEKTNKA